MSAPDANGWMPIEAAEKTAGIEILGTRWGFDATGKATCIREPFISFWSPSLNKFYCDPTHFIPSPKPPVSPSLPLIPLPVANPSETKILPVSEDKSSSEAPRSVSATLAAREAEESAAPQSPAPQEAQP